MPLTTSPQNLLKYYSCSQIFDLFWCKKKNLLVILPIDFLPMNRIQRRDGSAIVSTWWDSRQMDQSRRMRIKGTILAPALTSRFYIGHCDPISFYSLRDCSRGKKNWKNSCSLAVGLFWPQHACARSACNSGSRGLKDGDHQGSYIFGTRNPFYTVRYCI